VSGAKRIFDPIHRFIELDAGEAALLEAPALQRLRRLRQLGLAYLAYPSAEHTRFSHALGALAIGTRVIDALRVRSPDAFASDAAFATQRRLLRASLLLHDIGHGPFSHASEAVLGVRHESRTAEILALPQLVEPLAALEIDPADHRRREARRVDDGANAVHADRQSRVAFRAGCKEGTDPEVIDDRRVSQTRFRRRTA